MLFFGKMDPQSSRLQGEALEAAGWGCISSVARIIKYKFLASPPGMYSLKGFATLACWRYTPPPKAGFHFPVTILLWLVDDLDRWLEPTIKTCLGLSSCPVKQDTYYGAVLVHPTGHAMHLQLIFMQVEATGQTGESCPGRDGSVLHLQGVDLRIRVW